MKNQKNDKLSGIGFFFFGLELFSLLEYDLLQTTQEVLLLNSEPISGFVHA